jgi:phage shock protein C
VADRLYRSRDDRVIGGVAGGMAANLDLDPAIVRIGWVLLALVAPITPLVYFVLMFVIPEEPEAPDVPTWSALSSSAMSSAPAAPTAGREATAEVRREARRLARVARRGMGDRSAGLIFGVLLILVGAWFLLRPYLPSIDIGVYWPYVVIALGLVLIVAAARRGTDADD